MSKTLVFTGTITAVQPISFAQPMAADASKLPRIGGCLYLTASGIRSAVRHAMVGLIADIQQKKPTLDDYFLLTLGGIKDAKDTKSTKGDDEDEDEKKESSSNVAYVNRARFAREHNPAVSVFGSMKHGIPGRLFCSHAVAHPDVLPSVVRYVRANDFMRDPDLAQRLDEAAMSEFMERQTEAAKRTASKNEIELLDKQKRAAKKSGDEKEYERLSVLISDIKKTKDNSTAVQLSLPNLVYECIPQGTELTHEFVLENANDIEIALFLQSLNELALTPYLGGKKNHGLGRFSGKWFVRAREAGERKMESIGEIAIDGNFNEMVATNGLVQYLDRSVLEAFLLDPQQAILSDAALSAA